MLPQVKKRDGTTEKFSLINLSKVGVAAGLSAPEAKELVERIQRWAESLSVAEVTSIQIRDKFLEELPKINPQAAELYKWYEQTKEN